jgi:hypothetical protein
MDIQRLLDLRRITQAISRSFEADLKAHLSTLAPLFSPLPLFGEYVRGGVRSSGLEAEKAYSELRARYQSIATQPPFSLNVSLNGQLDLFAATPVLTPLEYPYTAHADDSAHPIRITSPLKWALSYPETEPKRLRALMAGDRSQVKDELSHALLQCLALSILVERRPGLARLFEALRHPLSSVMQEGLGSLPILMISAPIDTRLPADDIIIQNTQLSGIPSFEEIVDVDDIRRLSDPLRETLLEITRSQSPALYDEIAG